MQAPQQQDVSFTWETLAAMVSVSSVIVTVAALYVKLFIKAELLSTKDQIRLEMKDVIEEALGKMERQFEARGNSKR